MAEIQTSGAGLESGALYSVLFIARRHNSGQIPFAVLLLDSASDRLYMRFREDLADIADADSLEVLEGIPETIAQYAREEGATRIFQRFLDTLSGYVQMGEPHALPPPADWKHAIDALFEEHVKGSAV